MTDLEIDVGFIRLVGIRFLERSPDRVVLTWDVTPSLHQPDGILHGGVHATAVETAASIGAAKWFGDRGRVVGVSNQTDFLRAVSEGTLTATATPIHRGHSQQLWEVQITDERGRLVARGQVRLQNLAPVSQRAGQLSNSSAVPGCAAPRSSGSSPG